MIDRHIRKTKFHFSVGLILLLATLISGMTMFKSVPYFTLDYFVKQLDYLKYKNLVGATLIYNNTINENAKSVPVLVYHGIVKDNLDNGKKDDAQSGEGINISPEKFFNQMLALKKAGWNTVSIYDFYEFMEGKKDLPKKSFLLTFDDGRKDSYYPSDPILQALDFRATMFVITERSLNSTKKSSFYLSKMELKEMIKSGHWDIQSHGKLDHDLYDVDNENRKGHFLSNRLWNYQEKRLETPEEFATRINNDLSDSKTDIEKLGVKVVGFAYPFGDYGQDSINFPESQLVITDIIKSIYPMSFYQIRQDSGFSFNYPDQNQFLMKRIKVNSDWSPDDLLSVLDYAKEKSLPFSDNFSGYNGWTKTWGRMLLKDNSMILDSYFSTTGSSVFLDGARSWKDYVFNAKVDWKKGSNVVLLARYNDSDNYLDCNFSSKWLGIEKVIDGKKFIKENKIDADFSKTNLNLGIKVNGENIECMLDNKIIGSADIETDKLSKGGIGFKVWDKEVGNSELEVLEVSVNK